MYVAPDPLPPQLPADCPLAARCSVVALWVKAVPRLTLAPLLMARSPLMTVAALKDFTPPERVTLLYGKRGMD